MIRCCLCSLLPLYYPRTCNTRFVTPQLPEGGVPPRAASVRVYPVAVSEGVVYVWMGDNPWGEGAKEILPVPVSADRTDENKVRTRQERN